LFNKSNLRNLLVSRSKRKKFLLQLIAVTVITTIFKSN
jgi:hypothetical protein